MHFAAVVLRRSVRAAIASSKPRRVAVADKSGFDEIQRHGRRCDVFAELDLRVLDGEGDAMAKPRADDLQQTRDLFRLARARDQFEKHALVLKRVGEVDRRPGRELEIERVRHRQILFDEMRAESQQRHDRVEAEQRIEVRAADPHAGIGEDVAGAVGQGAPFAGRCG